MNPDPFLLPPTVPGPAPTRRRRWRKRAAVGVVGFVGFTAGVSIVEALNGPDSDVTASVAPSTTAEVVIEAPTTTVNASTTTTDPRPPASVVTEAPAPVVTEAPAPTTTQAPAPVVTQAPAPVVTEAPAPVAPVVVTSVVTNVVDGDTVDLDNGERVRLVGIDTPELGDCGADIAAATVTDMVLGKAVTLAASDEDRDQYGRLLRYVDVDGVDVGGTLLLLGQAVPRYNSTDGYGLHPREAEYAAIALPRPSPAPCPNPRLQLRPRRRRAARPHPRPQRRSASYKNCDDVRAHGAAPIYPGDPGWQQKFDRDRDGVGCE